MATLVPGFSDASWADPRPRLRTVILQHALAGGIELDGFSGQAERMRMPPQAGSQEPPDKEPAAAARQHVKAQPGHFDAHHAGRHSAPPA